MTSITDLPGHELSPPVEGGRPLAAPKTLEEAIAKRTREVRLARGLTLAELADRIGLSKAMLSKIENAQTSCSLATLDALAKGLEVPVTSLFRDADRGMEAVHVPADQAPVIVRRGSNLGHQFQLLGALTGRNKNLEPLLVTLTEESQVFPSFQHAGLEFIYVLEGVMDYVHQDVVYRMNPGDSLLFDAEGTHGPSDLVQTPIRFLSVFADQANAIQPLA